MPLRLASSPAEPARDPAAGYLRPGFARGSLMLRDDSGRFFRLDWESDDADAADRRRALPAGEYLLTGYRLIRADERGREWFVSATSQGIRPLHVTAGATLEAKLDDAIAIARRLDSDSLGMVIEGDGHGAPAQRVPGLSIYLEGRRIPIGYRLLDAQDRILAEGAMHYG